MCGMLVSLEFSLQEVMGSNLAEVISPQTKILHKTRRPCGTS